MSRCFLLSAALALVASTLLAQTDESALQVSVRGFADTYHAVRTEAPHDWMSSRTRLRGEVNVSHGSVGLFTSANVIYNAVVPDRTGFSLRECYLSYNSPHIEVRAGRQIITWGVVDGLRLTDVISPMDYSEFLAQDYDDIRVPVSALRTRLSGSNWQLDLVAVPVAQFFVLPSDSANPWSIGSLPPIEEPSRRLHHMEYGGRFSVFLSGIDFSLCALHTWQKTPSFHQGRWCYRRMGLVGGDLSVPVGQLVMRGEVASTLYDEGGTQALLGIDWYMPGSCTLSAQYAHQLLRQGTHRNSGLATLRLSKEWTDVGLTLQTFAYVDVSEGGIFDRSSADYALTDQLHLLLGYDLFHAKRGQFLVYRHNSEAWLKMKYSF
ncbi:MAG: hypothetical protein IJS20_12370 [Bacteroidales bacterium]|nr:hypothetical protein [Bacteroidales bacterium]